MGRFLLLSALAAALWGCGYTLAARSPAVPPGKSADVRLFTNRTYQPGIEGELRRALIGELASKGVGIAGEAADYVIIGEIVSLTTDTSAFSAADRAMVYRLGLEVQLQLSERKSGKTVWKGSEAVRGEYPATADLGLQRNAREAAVSAICARAARLLTERMNQAF